MNPSIERVRTQAQLGRFVTLPRLLYDGMLGYVAPLDHERYQLLDPRKSPFFTHGHAVYWIASRDGRRVGRISAQIDLAAEAPDAGAIGMFGCLDAIDDREVVAALFGTAEDWLRRHGRRIARGPFLLSINGETGLLIEGQTRPPMTLMPWHPPYLADRVRDGFVNVGARPGAGIGLVVDIDDLPFVPASIGELDVGDLPQRVTRERLVGTLMPHWRDLLVPGGHLRVVVRDASAMLDRIGARQCTFAEFQAAVFGGSNDDACADRVYTPDNFRGLLVAAGFVTIEMVRGDAPGEPCPTVTFIAQRPS